MEPVAIARSSRNWLKFSFLEPNWSACSSSREEGDGYHPQADFLQKIMPTIHEAIDRVAMKIRNQSVRVVCVANLGCVPGSNPISTVNAVIERMQQRFSRKKLPDFTACFQDFTGTEIVTLFGKFRVEEGAEQERPYHSVSIPGSLYGSLFPPHSVNFVISSFALHWLSKVPPEVLDKKSPAYNGHRPGLHMSSLATVKAYELQAQQDLSAFLAFRALEMTYGGLMVLVFGLRRDTLPYSVGMPVMLDEMIWGQKEPHSSEDELLQPSHAYYRTLEEVENVVSSCKEFQVKKKEVHPSPLESYSAPHVEKIMDSVSSKLKSTQNLLEMQFGQASRDWFLNYSRERLRILVLVLKRK